MQLRHWLVENGVSPLEFARRIGLAHGTSIYRYLDGGRVPARKFLVRIVVETKGAVTPADFYREVLKKV
jgi:hypothetical protein